MGREAGKKNLQWDNVWLIENYEPSMNLMDLRRLYNSTHGTDICEQTFRAKCYKLGIKGADYSYTEEQDKWLLENYNKYGNETYKHFNEKFGANKTLSGIRTRSLRLGASAYRGNEWDDDWIADRWSDVRNWNTLCNLYNSEHGTNISYNTFKCHCNRDLELDYHYTDEELDFLRENYPAKGIDYTAREFNKKFNYKRTKGSLGVRCKLMGLKVTEERTKDVNDRIGSLNRLPINSKIEKEHGEIYVKTENGWKREKDIVFGEKPKGYIIVHLDKNVKNNSKENLCAIPRGVCSRMSINKFWSENRDITKTGILACQLEDALNRKMGEK